MKQVIGSFLFDNHKMQEYSDPHSFMQSGLVFSTTGQLRDFDLHINGRPVYETILVLHDINEEFERHLNYLKAVTKSRIRGIRNARYIHCALQCQLCDRLRELECRAEDAEIYYRARGLLTAEEQAALRTIRRRRYRLQRRFQAAENEMPSGQSTV